MFGACYDLYLAHPITPILQMGELRLRGYTLADFHSEPTLLFCTESELVESQSSPLKKHRKDEVQKRKEKMQLQYVVKF